MGAAEFDRKWRLRNRVIDTVMLMLLIFRLVSSKNTQSYGTSIDDLWDNCKKLNLALPQKNSIAPSSFCAARQKLDEAVFKRAHQKILAAYAVDASRYSWLGHRLFAIDGSKINLPRKLLHVIRQADLRRLLPPTRLNRSSIGGHLLGHHLFEKLRVVPG